MELEWATAHFFLSLSHNTASCIVTQGLKGMAWETGLGKQQARRGAQQARRGPPRHGVVGLGHGPATRPTRVTTRPASTQGRATASARNLAARGVAIQTLYRG